MQRSVLFCLLGVVAFIFLFVLSLSPVSSAVNHIVISQVQIEGTTAADEFVELYNPTAQDVDLSGFRLTRKTSSGTQGNLVASLSGTIKARSYFLITPQSGYTGSSAADLEYSVASAPLASDNTIIIYSDEGVSVVDKVGMGDASDFEASTTAVPGPGESIARMIDDTGGNGLDTDNNENDFELSQVSNPRNSSVTILPTETPTPTEVPTDTPTPTSEPTSTVTPTPTEIVTPTPTESEPTPTSVDTPTPTSSLTITPTSTPSPTLSPIPGAGVAPQFRVSCVNKPIVFQFKFMKITVPFMSCKLNKI